MKYVPDGVHTSLVIPVQARSGSVTQTLRALVDTGAAMPLVIRTGAFPASVIQKSTWPVKFVTASGTVMTGGTTGVKLEISLPVAVPGQELVNRVECEALWAYEADLHSTEMIIGYPFLKGFGLAVDPGANSLVFSSAALKKTPQEQVDRQLVQRSARQTDVQSFSDPKSLVRTAGTPVHAPVGPKFFQMDRCQVGSAFHLVAEFYSLIWMMTCCLQLSVRQSSLSPDKSSTQCRSLECGCHDPVYDKQAYNPEVWTPTDPVDDRVLQQFKCADPSWFDIATDQDEKQAIQLSPVQLQIQKDSWVTETFTVTAEWVQRIVQFSDLEPTIDAFASKGNQRFPRYWTRQDDAFSQDWSTEVIWANPPFSLMDKVIQKILQDEAHGILIIPCWDRCLWFTVLQTITVKWMDIPHNVCFYQSVHGRLLRQRPGWKSRAVVFDAFQVLSRLSISPMKWNVVKESFQAQIQRISDFPDLTDQDALSQMPLRMFLMQEVEMPMSLNILQAQRLKQSMETDAVKQIFSVIESTEQHPEADPFIQKIQVDYKDVLYETVLAKDVDPDLRGPYGVAHIELKPDAVPQKRKPFRMLGEKEEAFRQLIKKFLDRGWIETSDSEWGSQAFLVTKPSAADPWRMVVDYRYVNTVTKDFPFPLPLIEDLICKESQNRIWSIFDLESGFHQMHLDPASRAVTAFVTPWCNYQWTVLPMGIKQAPALFQRLVNWILRDVPRARAYVDDILTGTPDSGSGDLVREHAKDIGQVLQAFRKYKVTVKGVKVHLFRKMIKFCGHILFDGKRKAAPSKLEALNKWNADMIKTVTHLKGFLGLAQYYAQYVKNFADIAVPLTAQLKGREKNRPIVWTDEMRTAFSELKRQLLDNVVLDIADPYRPYVLEVDASDYAVGGVLSQEDHQGSLRPVAFFSRKLEGSPGKGQVGWSIREKETYAIVLMLLKFRSWVASSQIKIKVLTDHESLQHWHTEDLNKMIGSVARRGRWHEFLSQFNLEIVYVPGKEHKVSDALSRWIYPASTDTQEKTFHGDSQAQKYADFMQKLEDDHDFETARIAAIDKGVFQEDWRYGNSCWKTEFADLQRHVQHDYHHLEKGKLYIRGKLCVPDGKTEAVIQFYHSAGHPSGAKLFDIVFHRCQFEQDLKKVQKLCFDIAQTCHVCQAVKPSSKSYGTLDYCPVPSQIFSSLCMDFLSLPKVSDSSGEQFDSVFVVVDRLSGYIMGVPCSKAGLTAERTAELFIRHCVYLTGVPLEILSDHDSLITSKFFQAMCEQLGIEQHSAVIYRPKGNGRAERAVRSVIGILRLTLTGMRNSSKWIDVLPWACFLQNSLPGVIAGYSPHQIVFGRRLILPGELPSDQTTDIPVAAGQWLEKLEDSRKYIQDRLMKIHEKERARYISEHCLQKYEPGDKVWLKTLSKDKNKLDPLWMGPCEILKHVHGGRYTVQTPFGDEDHHMDSFKPYKTDLKGKSIPFLYYKPPTVPEDDNWIVEKILKHRQKDGRLQWLVKWKGHKQQTWEYAEQFVGHTQSDWKEYNQKHNIAVTFE